MSRRRRRAVGLLCGVVLCLTRPSEIAAMDAAATFARKCSSCHTFGRGVLIGPDLKGVTDRRTREWLAAWVASSERLIRAGDPIHDRDVAVTERIGITRCADWPLRWIVNDNPYVSRTPAHFTRRLLAS